MRIFVMGAALRQGSFNRKLAHAAAALLGGMPGVTLDLAEFREFEMPVYDGDLEESAGIPPGAVKLIDRLRAADAIVFSAPEYNGGISGAFKNAIDWVSRAEQVPIEGKPILLLGASPGSLGATRGLWHSKVPLEALSAFVYPEVFGLPRAHEAFDVDGKLKDPKAPARLRAILQGFLAYAAALTQGRAQKAAS